MPLSIYTTGYRSQSTRSKSRVTFVEQENPASPGDTTPNRSTSVTTAAATDASHSFETYPVDATAV
jgi:hypothetical protein